MYADEVTESMKAAIDETRRRREIQMRYNQECGIVPQTIKKEIRAAISYGDKVSKKSKKKTEDFDFNDLSQKDQQEMISGLEEQMREAAKKLDFEEAARLRDTVLELKAEIE